MRLYLLGRLASALSIALAGSLVALLSPVGGGAALVFAAALEIACLVPVAIEALRGSLLLDCWRCAERAHACVMATFAGSFLLAGSSEATAGWLLALCAAAREEAFAPAQAPPPWCRAGKLAARSLLASAGVALATLPASAAPGALLAAAALLDLALCAWALPGALAPPEAFLAPEAGAAA